MATRTVFPEADLALLWLRQACATVGDATFSTPFRGVGGGGGSSSSNSVGSSVGGDSVGGGKAGGGLGGTSWSGSTLGLLASVGSKDDKSGTVGASAGFAGAYLPLVGIGVIVCYCMYEWIFVSSHLVNR